MRIARTISFDLETYKELVRISKETDTPISRLIERAIKQYYKTRLDREARK